MFLSTLIPFVLVLLPDLTIVECKRLKIPCEVRSNQTVVDCTDDYRKRMRKDLNEREECCALARLRHCVNDAMEEECSADEGEETYLKWRKDDDVTHPEMTTRCIDDSHDKLECIFLNFMAEVIISFVVFLLLILILITSCIWLIFFRSTRRSHLDL